MSFSYHTVQISVMPDKPKINSTFLLQLVHSVHSAAKSKENKYDDILDFVPKCELVAEFVKKINNLIISLEASDG